LGAISDFRRNQRQVQGGVNILLGRRRLQSAVTSVQAGRAEAEAGRGPLCPQRGEVLARSGQIEQGGAGVPGFGTTDTDLYAIERKIKAALAPMQPASGVEQRSQL